MHVTLVRHGMTAGNKLKRYIGTTDEPLCEEGIEALKEQHVQAQANEGISELGKKQIWYLSPLKRCLQTKEILAPGAPEKIVEDLRECDFGQFENKNYMELDGDPAYQAWIDSGGTMAFPGGESREAFSERCCDAFAKCVDEALEKGYETIAFCVHGGTIMSIMERFCVRQDGTGYGYYDWHVGNGACIGLDIGSDWKVERKIIKDDRIS